MARCGTCNKILIWGMKREGQRFCNLQCFAFALDELPAFCPDCRARTTDEGFGDVELDENETFSSILIAKKERCPQCHSVEVREKRSWLVGLRFTDGRPYLVKFFGGGIWAERRVI